MSEFVVDYRLNREFESPLAISFSIEGTGAALFLWGQFLGFQTAMLAGLVFIFLGIIVLMFDLGNPLRFWRVITKAKTSWISRGSIFIGGLAGSGTVYYALPRLFPQYAEPNLMIVIALLSILFAFAVMLYPGFLLSSMTPIPLWNTPLIPVLFLSQAAASGAAVYCAVSTVTLWNMGAFPKVLLLNIVLQLITLIMVGIHFVGMRNSSNAARHSIRLLTIGEFKFMFVAGGIGAGLIFPLVLTAYLYIAGNLSGVSILVLIMAFARLTGDVLYRYALLRAGVFEPLI